MLPLVEELSFGLGDGSAETAGCDDASSVECVAARGGLASDDAKVSGDAWFWVRGGEKTLELRVPRVTASATEEHRLREKRLAPECNQAGGVEMARMESPETHESGQRIEIRSCDESQGYFAVADPNQVVSASASPAWLASPTQAT